MGAAAKDETPLLCELGWHKPHPLARWNAGYYFTTCNRCGRDLVKSANGSWRVPKGFRVVWQAHPPEGAAAAGMALDAKVDPANDDQMQLPIQEVLRRMEAEERAGAMAEAEPLAEATALETKEDEAVRDESFVEDQEAIDEPAGAEVAPGDTSDTATEAETEAEIDAGTGADLEEVKGETGAFVESDRDPAADKVLEPEPELEAEAEAIEEVDAEADPDPADEAELEPEAEAASEAEPKVEEEPTVTTALEPAAVDDFMENDWFMSDEPGYESWDQAAEHRIGDADVEIEDDERERVGNRSGRIRYGKEVASVERTPTAFFSMLREEDEDTAGNGIGEVPKPSAVPPPSPSGGSGRSPVNVAIAGSVGALVLVAAIVGLSQLRSTGAPADETGNPQVEAATPEVPTAVGLPMPQETAYVTASILNCRSAPARQASSMRRLGRGEAVQIIAVDETWASILHRGRQCWVFTRYLSTVAPL